MKRISSLVVVLALLICFASAYITTATAASPGTAADPLAAVSYLTRTLLPSILADVQARFDATVGQKYNDASARLGALHTETLMKLGMLDGYTLPALPVSYTFKSGDTMELVMGSSFTPLSGSPSLTVTKGTVINLSTGEEVPSGAVLQIGQRYFCVENTSAKISAASAVEGIVDGYFRTTAVKTPQPLPFLDVKPEDWFCPAVNYAYSKSLFNGTTTFTFSPQDSMSRAMFVTVLYRMAGSPATPDPVFSDVTSPTLYYYKAVGWANANRLVTGYDDGRFHPDDPITREQMAAIMYRYADFAGYSVQTTDTSSYDAFPDKESVSAFAVNALHWATGKNIINGSDGRLLPQDSATRAQVAQIIMNFSQKVAGG